MLRCEEPQMQPLVEGIFQCPNCKKILKEKEIKVEDVDEETTLIGRKINGDWFHNNASLNQNYEIADSGFIVNKTDSRR